jgi:hypothetical protein
MHRPPHAHGGRAKDLVSPPDRETEAMEGPPESLQQERVSIQVLAKELRASLAVSQAEGRRLVPGGVSRSRNDQLEHDRPPVVEDRLGHEGFARVGVRVSDRDGPLRLDL